MTTLRDLGEQTLLTARDAAPVSFLGRMSRIANYRTLDQAERMVAQGKPREEIFNATQWFQGPDKMWRFELPDFGARLKFKQSDYPHNTKELNALIDEPQLSIADRFLHPKLYRAYPELRDIGYIPYPQAAMPNVSGFQGPKGIGVAGEVARNPSKTGGASTMLHELQHKIQDIEGFGPGASTRTPDVVFEAARNVGSSLAVPPGTPFSMEGLHQALMQSPQGQRALYDAYRRVAGEAEARNVQTRFALTPDARFREPWLTYDVPEASQIVLPEGQFPLPMRYPKTLRELGQ